MRQPLTVKDLSPNTVIRGKNGGDGWYRPVAVDSYGIVLFWGACYESRRVSWEDLMQVAIMSEDGVNWKSCYHDN